MVHAPLKEQLNVLLVSDNQDLPRMFHIDPDIKCQSVTSVIDALHLMTTQNFDAAIIDCGLPVVSADEREKKIVEQERGKKLAQIAAHFPGLVIDPQTAEWHSGESRKNGCRLAARMIQYNLLPSQNIVMTSGELNKSDAYTFGLARAGFVTTGTSTSYAEIRSHLFSMDKPIRSAAARRSGQKSSRTARSSKPGSNPPSTRDSPRLPKVRASR